MLGRLERLAPAAQCRYVEDLLKEASQDRSPQKLSRLQERLVSDVKELALSFGVGLRDFPSLEAITDFVDLNEALVGPRALDIQSDLEALFRAVLGQEKEDAALKDFLAAVELVESITDACTLGFTPAKHRYASRRRLDASHLRQALDNVSSG